METLDSAITSRRVNCSDLSWHILECGDPARDSILLLHGFPELAFSWRKVMPLLAQAGYHVIAPDLRGYGGTFPLSRPASSPVTFEDGCSGFCMIDTTSELVSLLHILRPHDPVVRVVIGHDMGSAIAAILALVRPDMFHSLIMMSAPYTGPPTPPGPSPPVPPINHRSATLEALSNLPVARLHYQQYFCTESANADLMEAKQGLADFYRGYYYFKSAHHDANHPKKLGDIWTAEGLLMLPEYYLMFEGSTMPETVARHVDIKVAQQQMQHWMNDSELAYYVQEFQRTGFQGGLMHYRARLQGHDAKQLAFLAGAVISVPTTFISGERDWGIYQDPGALERMQSASVVQQGKFVPMSLIPDAGHWVQQEQPERTTSAILTFLSHHAHNSGSNVR